MLVNRVHTLTPDEIAQVQQLFSRPIGKISLQDVYDYIKKNAEQLLAGPQQISGASGLIAQKNELLIRILDKRIDSSHIPNGQIQFLDISQPFDNLSEFLIRYHSHTLFCEDTQDSAENFLDLLRMIISLIRKEYNKLDREHGPRTDGSIRFSHAWETMCIMIQEFQCISKESILAILLHDYFEDVPGTNKMKEQKIRLLLENTQGVVDVDKIIDMILKMSKEPLENYLEFPHRFIFSVKNKKNQQAFLDQHKPRLQEKQREAYYRSFHAYDIFLIAGKCADRLHALRHFDKNPIDKVQRKLKETKQYFMPVLQNRMKSTLQIEEKQLLEDIYHRMLVQMDICLQVCKICMEHKKDIYDIQIEKELPGYHEPTINPKRTLFIPKNPNKIKK